MIGVHQYHNTYYDHKARWFSVPCDARDKAVAAGYTEEGQYNRFLVVHTAKDAEVKAAISTHS